MKKLLLLLVFLASGSSLQAQWLLNVVGDGGNKKASVSENIGLAKITINYDRPGVKGREGKIWGTDVAHYGLKDLGFGTSTASPWRAGANENTTIGFSEDVKVEGKDLPAGTYGFHIILGETDDVLIFSKRNDAWGSFYYNPAEDALRVNIKHQDVSTSTERLKYEFINQTENAATIALFWEKRMFPFKIEADVHKIQLASFRHELDTKPGFNWLAYVQAARYCLDNNIELNQALIWADQGINERYVGQKNFQTLSTKANVLSKLGRNEDAKKTMAEALPMGTMIDLYQYGRSLINTKKPKEALAVFQLNYKKNPDMFNTNVGLGRAYSANGDYKKALPYIEKAIKQAPDVANKEYMQGLKAKLEKGMDIN
jgi:tetratricopeptide (TPR) repeat protein